MDNITIIGLIAGLMTTFSFLPQVIEILKTKDVKSISLLMYGIYICGIVLYIIYGFLINEIVLILANFLSLIFGITMLCLKLRYK